MTRSSSPDRPTLRWTAPLTALALTAFAANSILCRLALDGDAIDAASFTAVRIGAGAVALWGIRACSARGPAANLRGVGGDWGSAALLFLYAAPFSIAYVSLPAGTGALLLFGSVQATMIVSATRAGERLSRLEWSGFASALAGLVYLVLPGVSAPSPLASALMLLSGVGWGLYSIRGRGQARPLRATAGNFLRCLPLVSVLSVASWSSAHFTREGLVLAAVSGAVTSGAGYAIWYSALRGLTGTQAAFVQLTVPVIAAVGGALFLHENLTLRLGFAGLLVLGGVTTALAAKTRSPARDPASR